MFTDLENEIVRILRANLSPALVPSDRIVNGPIDTPAPGQRPGVAFTASAFEIVPMEEVSPPPGVKALVEEAFGPNGDGPLTLSRPPLEPLRAVELEETPGGDRILLRERDDYTVDYVNGQVRLRQAPEGDVHVRYFTRQPLRVVSAARLRVDSRLEVWASDSDLHAITTTALGAIAANAAGMDGLLTEGRDVVDSGLASLGTRRVFFIFEGLRPIGGTQPEPTKWEINYTVGATMVLVPRDEEIGVMRYIAAGVAWDDKLAELVLSTPPPILGEPVTLIQGVGPATAAGLADRGITTVGQLAQAAPTGQAQIDSAISRAQTIRDRSHQVVRQVVQAMPDIPDVAAFLELRLADVDAGDLTAVRIPEATANEIVAALGELVAQTTVPGPRLSDLFFT
jgi:hypothetical protein